MVDVALIDNNAWGRICERLEMMDGWVQVAIDEWRLLVNGWLMRVLYRETEGTVLVEVVENVINYISPEVNGEQLARVVEEDDDVFTCITELTQLVIKHNL